MKIRFTVTLTDETVRNYRNGGWPNAGEIVEDLKSVLQHRLNDVNNGAYSDEDLDDEGEDDEDDDLDEEDD